MNILIITWKWENTGGDWTYVKNLTKLYAQQGHNIIALSMTGELENVANEKHYTIRNIDFKIENNKRTFASYFKVVNTVFYNKETRNLVKDILRKHDIDLIHIHNIRNSITQSFFSLVDKRKTKIVWSLHDYNLICPDIHFVRDNQICEDCKGKKYYNVVINKCKKNSFSASFIACLSSYHFHIMKYVDKVDLFLCPSEFLMLKFIEYGFPQNKMSLSNYCFDTESLKKTYDEITNLNLNEDFILYVGRIEKIKGIETLIDAMARVPDIKLIILGDGSFFEHSKKIVEERGLINISFHGKQPPNIVYDYIKASKFVVVPSEWYENYPFSVIESFLLSTPVLGARIGGIPELVIDYKTGMLFEAGNSKELAIKIKDMINADIDYLGNNAYDHALNIVSYPNHLKKLRTEFNKINLTL